MLYISSIMRGGFLVAPHIQLSAPRLQHQILPTNNLPPTISQPPSQQCKAMSPHQRISGPEAVTQGKAISQVQGYNYQAPSNSQSQLTPRRKRKSNDNKASVGKSYQKEKDNFEPTPPNCKKRILDSDDSDDEIWNRNESEPERKKIRNAFFCDLVWPLTKMDEREYSRRFKLQMMEAMDMFNQRFVRLAV